MSMLKLFLRKSYKNQPVKNIIPYLLENALTLLFSNLTCEVSRLGNSNPESFVVNCLTRFRDNQPYLK